MAEKVADVTAEVHADTHALKPEIEAGLRQIEGALKKAFPDGGSSPADRYFRRQATNINRFAKQMDKLGDGIGRAFGKGSRNNFLNTFGGFMSALPNLIAGGIGLFGRFADKIADLGDQFTKLREEGASAFAALGKTGLSGLQGVLSSGAAGIVAIGAAAVILVGALGPLVSMISLLAGALIALTSAVAAGLLGVLLAAAPAALALGAAVGVVILAFNNMSDSQKKAFEPLKKQFTDLGKTVADVFFKDIPTWVKVGSDVLKNFAGPIMTGVAAQVRDSITSIAKVFASPEFMNLLKPLTTELPRIAGTLTHAVGEALLGIMAGLVPLLPFAERLAKKIDDLATSFANWAKSAEGQNSIKDFMDKAWGAAQQLWGILQNVWGIISTLFFAGQPTGKSFLDSINESLGQFNTWLASDAGRTQLNQWFQDAKTFADQLVTSIGDIGRFLVSLDTPANRAFATGLITAVDAIMLTLDAFKPVILAVGAVFAAMALVAIGALVGLLTTMSQVAGAFAAFLHALANIPGFGWAEDAAKKMDGVADSSSGAAAKLGELPGKIQDLIDKANGVPETHVTEFTAVTSPLFDSTQFASQSIDDVAKSHLTNFDGKHNALDVATGESTAAIVAVPPSKTSVLLGNNGDILSSAIGATGAINAVPPSKNTTLSGDESDVRAAAGSATSAVAGVPSEKTTYLNGDISGLLAKIAVAKSQIAGLMAQSNGLAMTAADLGGRAAGAIVGLAGGAMLRGPQIVLAGEAGPEAIVPLRRSLSQVDPSVRALSAIAQGKAFGGGIQPGAIVVNTNMSNPELVAEAVLDRLALTLG